MADAARLQCNPPARRSREEPMFLVRVPGAAGAEANFALSSVQTGEERTTSTIEIVRNHRAVNCCSTARLMMPRGGRGACGQTGWC
jgi:hypothetical protein